MTRIAIAASIVVFGLSACQKGQDQSQANDSTARNLTLAPAESTAAMRDMPPAAHPTNPPPATRPPAARPPAPPPAPRMSHLGVGTKIDVASNDTLSSRTAKVGDAFTAHVVEDVRDASGKVVIPAGSVVNATITEVKPAPNPSTPGTLTVSVTSITVRGTSYPIDAAVDSIETIHKGVASRPVMRPRSAWGQLRAPSGPVLGGNRRARLWAASWAAPWAPVSASAGLGHRLAERRISSSS
jgi:hypothetical protein